MSTTCRTSRRRSGHVGFGAPPAIGWTLMVMLGLGAGCSSADGGGGTMGRGGSGGQGGHAGDAGSGGQAGGGGAGPSDAGRDALDAPGQGHQVHDGGSAGGSAGNDRADVGLPSDAPLPGPAPLPAAMQAIAGELHGAFLQVDCASEEIELQYCHPQDKGIRNIPLRVGGEAGRNYQFVLRVWGVMETITYRNGMKAGERFYIGGERTTPMNAEYGLRTANQTFWLNHMDIAAGDHYTYGIQYTTPPIAIPGASTVTLFVRDPDDFMNTNHMDSMVEDPTPALQARLDLIRAQPLQGQFVYIEVVRVTGP